MTNAFHWPRLFAPSLSSIVFSFSSSYLLVGALGLGSLGDIVSIALCGADILNIFNDNNKEYYVFHFTIF